MIDTKVKVNGKTVAEYDLINEPCVKQVNGESPDDHGNVNVASGSELPESVPYKESHVVKRSDYTGEEITAGGYSYVSSLTPTYDELSANGLVVHNSITDGLTEQPLTSMIAGTESYCTDGVAVAFVDNAVLYNGTVLPKAGIYFSNGEIPGYGTQSLSWTKINKVSADMLPSSVPVINKKCNVGNIVIVSKIDENENPTAFTTEDITQRITQRVTALNEIGSIGGASVLVNDAVGLRNLWLREDIKNDSDEIIGYRIAPVTSYELYIAADTDSGVTYKVVYSYDGRSSMSHVNKADRDALLNAFGIDPTEI